MFVLKKLLINVSDFNIIYILVISRTLCLVDPLVVMNFCTFRVYYRESLLGISKIFNNMMV